MEDRAQDGPEIAAAMATMATVEAATSTRSFSSRIQASKLGTDTILERALKHPDGALWGRTVGGKPGHSTAPFS
jgi:hypothetical protein